jgi:hypothetical protein
MNARRPHTTSHGSVSGAQQYHGRAGGAGYWAEDGGTWPMRVGRDADGVGGWWRVMIG